MFEKGFDTIAAVATPPVPSAIGILRISGGQSLTILRHVFRPVKGRGFPPRRMRFGGIYTREGLRIDEGLAVFMPGPASYTGEDTAEIYCHGSPGVMAALLDTLFAAGARQAEPGEFTRRAFLNGRIDLSQSEAVIDLIESETKAAAANAAAQLEGVLGRQLTAVRDELILIASQLAAMIDFPDEEVPELEQSALLSRLEAACEALERLHKSYERGAVLKNGVPCAITGKPNVGKSSLLNAFAGFERAIVTEIPGTTRDVLEHTVIAGGVKLSFFDTAGIRETEDTVEKIGVMRAADAVRTAAAVLAVFDVSRPLTPEDELVMERTKGRETWCVLNKSDLPVRADEAYLRTRFSRVFPVSAATGEGIDILLTALASHFTASQESGGSFITNPRQANALERAVAALRRAMMASRELTADVVCTDVEEAASVIGEITGQTASEDIIDQIFARFCVGK